MIKKHISIILIALFVLGMGGEAYSQRTSTRTSKRTSSREVKENKASFADKLNYEISIGNISFNQGFQISFKPHVAYNIIDRVSAGIGLRGFFYFENRPAGSDDISYFDYGPSLFGRFKITPEFFLQTEYTYMNYDYGPFADRTSAGSPLIGGGYMSGYGPWKFGIQLMFITDDDVRNEERSSIDYWFSFSYNF